MTADETDGPPDDELAARKWITGYVEITEPTGDATDDELAAREWVMANFWVGDLTQDIPKLQLFHRGCNQKLGNVRNTPRGRFVALLIADVVLSPQEARRRREHIGYQARMGDAEAVVMVFGYIERPDLPCPDLSRAWCGRCSSWVEVDRGRLISASIPGKLDLPTRVRDSGIAQR
jgi:hypothetical protein